MHRRHRKCSSRGRSSPLRPRRASRIHCSAGPSAPVPNAHVMPSHHKLHSGVGADRVPDRQRSADCACRHATLRRRARLLVLRAEKCDGSAGRCWGAACACVGGRAARGRRAVRQHGTGIVVRVDATTHHGRSSPRPSTRARKAAPLSHTPRRLGIFTAATQCQCRQITSLAWSKSQALIVTASHDGTCRIWDAQKVREHS